MRALRLNRPLPATSHIDVPLVDPRKIPVYINNHNRLSTLRNLIEWLIGSGTEEIIVLDNDSSYPPLLQYYKEVPRQVKIERLEENAGPFSFWKRGYDKKVLRPFVLTDSDVLPDDGCPKDLIAHLNKLLHDNAHCLKAGPSIRIDEFENVEESQKLNGWGFGEQRQWWSRRHSDEAFYAPVDTTFALYGSGAIGHAFSHNNLRTDFPYVIRHLPWYFTLENMTEEEKYYRMHTNQGPNATHPWSHNHRLLQKQETHPWEKIHLPCVPQCYTIFNRSGYVADSDSLDPRVSDPDGEVVS